MAADYTIESAQATTELVGSSEVQDVVQVWVRSRPDEVVYPLRIPDAVFGVSVASSMAAQSAAVVGQVHAFPEVAAMGHVQDVNPAGALLDQMEVYVQSSNGLLTDRIVFPLSNFVPPAPVGAAAGAGGVGTTGGGGVGIYGTEPAPTGDVTPGPDLLGGPTTAGPTTADATAPAPEFITPGDVGGGLVGGDVGGTIIGGGGVTAWLPPVAAMQRAIQRAAAQLDYLASL